MMEVEIRRASLADVAPITEIVNDAYHHYVERMGCRPAPMLADYDRLIGEGCVWVLEMEKDVSGLIILRLHPDHVLVSNMAVGRARQGMGFGRRLLDYAEAYARENDVRELRLFTNELMHENVAIYTKLGWQEYMRAEQDGFHRVFMRKRFE